MMIKEIMIIFGACSLIMFAVFYLGFIKRMDRLYAQKNEKYTFCIEKDYEFAREKLDQGVYPENFKKQFYEKFKFHDKEIYQEYKIAYKERVKK